jgi:hypothetical protein
MKLCKCGCGMQTPIGENGRRRVFAHISHRKGEHSSHWKGGRYVCSWGYVHIYAPGHPRANGYGYVREHLLVAERALGRPIPKENQVHHVDGNGSNNAGSNLVICESNKYHQLLHVRTEALRLSGHADWLRCKYCQQYSPTSDLYISPKETNQYHPTCANRFNAQLRMKARR